MDNKTRELRRRNKALARDNRDLKSIEPRGLGRKGKPSGTFPAKQCSHIEGGKRTLIFRRRKKPLPGQSPRYAIEIVKGGHRCPNTAVANGRCLDHLASESRLN